MMETDRTWGPEALQAQRDAVRRHQAEHAAVKAAWIERNRYYYDALRRLLRFIVEPGRRVIHVRCQTGHLLGALQSSHGVGVALSEEMAAIARERCPRQEFICADPEHVEVSEKFDYVLFSGVSETVDVEKALLRARDLCEPHSRLVLHTYNHLWEPLLTFADRVGLKAPSPEQSWLSESDLRNLLDLCGFEWIRTYRAVLLPKNIPLLSGLLNRWIAHLPGINRLCSTVVMVARPVPPAREPSSVSVSIVIPCKNEKGNIEPAVQRIPEMGRHTEIIFCDDKSTDGTADEVRRVQAAYPHRDIKLVDGPGICKAENVWVGFRAADGDVLMILDADLTVMPEELPYFFEAIVRGKGEFVNGSRLVYPIPRMAMKFTNMMGNKVFGKIFSYILDWPIKDTLCGTKVLWRRDWQRIEPMIGSWGTKDRWGDYELLFGAARLQLRIIELPVHYQERVYGATKMVRVFQNGVNMLRMCWHAWLKMKVM